MALLWLLLALIAPCRAHELGAVQIICTFAASSNYTVEVLVDREHLPFRLARVPADDFAATFLQESQFRFDGRLQNPKLESVQHGAGPNQFQLRLNGGFPPGAKTFAFHSEMDLNEYFLRLKNASEPITLGFWLTKDSSHPPFELKQPTHEVTTFDVLRQYLVLGFTHIVPKGLDHILFVLGLFLLSVRAKPLLLQITAFTVAHSITLALSMYGWVSLPASIVEPLIALSIAYVAIENMLIRDYRPTRLLIVFGFGLLHGLGFAGVLTELGLPREQFLPALVSFNVGVELGQLAVILAAMLGVGLWFSQKQWYRRRITIPASTAIALAGLYWTVTRIVSL
jgi:hydrogenase/urease accessory protein HupE